MYFFAIIFQFFMLAPAVFKTMQADPYTGFRQGFYFVEKIENATVIRRVGNIKTDYMKMLIQSVK
jgi:hypothetical protein